MSSASIEPTAANGYEKGRPDHRPRHPMDEVITTTIGELKYELRLYPDVYSWIVTDAVLAAAREQVIAELELIAELRSAYTGDEVQLQVATMRSAAKMLRGDKWSATGMLPSWLWGTWTERTGFSTDIDGED